MKVIGMTNDGYILEASCDDINGIQGLYRHEKKIKIGDEINFDGLFRKYTNVNTALDNIEKLRYTAELLTNAVDWIEQFRSDE